MYSKRFLWSYKLYLSLNHIFQVVYIVCRSICFERTMQYLNTRTQVQIHQIVWQIPPVILASIVQIPSVILASIVHNSISYTHMYIKKIHLLYSQVYYKIPLVILSSTCILQNSTSYTRKFITKFDQLYSQLYYKIPPVILSSILQNSTSYIRKYSTKQCHNELWNWTPISANFRFYFRTGKQNFIVILNWDWNLFVNTRPDFHRSQCLWNDYKKGVSVGILYRSHVQLLGCSCMLGCSAKWFELCNDITCLEIIHMPPKGWYTVIWKQTWKT